MLYSEKSKYRHLVYYLLVITPFSCSEHVFDWSAYPRFGPDLLALAADDFPRALLPARFGAQIINNPRTVKHIRENLGDNERLGNAEISTA